MKRRWHKLKYVALSVICFNLLIGTSSVYAEESAKGQVEQVVEGQDNLEVSEIAEEVTEEIPEETSDEDAATEEKRAQQKQIYLTLVAIFGVAILTAIVTSISYRIYLSKKVTTLPVLYYGDKGEALYE